MELSSTKLDFTVHCMQLRHKAMYVNTIPNPGEDKFFDAYDSASYWCSLTQTSFGPDGHPARPDVCQAGRGCCNH